MTETPPPPPPPIPPAAVIRRLDGDDLDEVVRIDALHTGSHKRRYWDRVFRDFVGEGNGEETFGFGVEGEGGLAGYLLAEVRAVEFGSEPCGWVFAVGIEEGWKRKGIASALFEAVRRRFRELGVERIRTMVRRNDVPVLSFFRSSGFVGGPYVQLELDLDGSGEGGTA